MSVALIFHQNNISNINRLTFQPLSSSLVFLTLAHNKLTKLTGFAALKNLVLLDLEANLIDESAFKNDADLTEDLLPHSLQYLFMRENPISQKPDYRLIVVGDAPWISELDQKEVSNLERRIALRASK